MKISGLKNQKIREKVRLAASVWQTEDFEGMCLVVWNLSNNLRQKKFRSHVIWLVKIAIYEKLFFGHSTASVCQTRPNWTDSQWITGIIHWYDWTCLSLRNNTKYGDFSEKQSSRIEHKYERSSPIEISWKNSQSEAKAIPFLKIFSEIEISSVIQLNFQIYIWFTLCSVL